MNKKTTIKKSQLREMVRRIIKEEYPKSVNSPNWTLTTTGIGTSSSKKRIPKAKGNFEEPTEENLKKYGLDPDKVKINSDSSIDYRGDVILSVKNLKHIPFQFNNVSGKFECLYKELTSLQGAPKEVGGDFGCSGNNLTSLQGAPQKVGGGFYCRDNKLTSLQGAPQKVGGKFLCLNNKLTSLQGAPKEVGGDFGCSGNNLTSLQGAPKVVYGDFSGAKNRTKFTKEDVMKVSNVKGDIRV